ncbi:MAG: V-type ATP synthase subunit A, partial [Monoglobaceae bacterium]
MTDRKAFIYGINGPVVTVKNAPWLMMKEMVFVGDERLIGEVIAIHGDSTIIQVYEETSGVKIGEPVETTGAPMSVTLGPGLIGNIFDGIERPLRTIKDMSGAFISRGLRPDAVDMDKKWEVKITAQKGEEVTACAVIGEIQETSIIVNKVMLPPDVSGTIEEIVPSGSYTCKDVICKVKTADGEIKEIKLVQEWPIRTPRPNLKREPISVPLVTGQRVIDILFPLAKGGTAAIPGGFGTGKTMTQHQLAKWSDAD